VSPSASPPPVLTTPNLLAVNVVDGITYYSGAGAGWTVPEHSDLVSYACSYDLCDITAVFDGTEQDPLGGAIDFAGPNYQSLPYTFTIDMGEVQTFTHWRVAGNGWYSFQDAHLANVPGSDVDYTNNRADDGFVYAAFSSPVAAQHWQTVITSYGNPDYQASFQCYLTEVQFGLQASID